VETPDTDKEFPSDHRASARPYQEDNDAKSANHVSFHRRACGFELIFGEDYIEIAAAPNGIGNFPNGAAGTERVRWSQCRTEGATGQVDY
jgi:hypothetical protein